MELLSHELHFHWKYHFHWSREYHPFSYHTQREIEIERKSEVSDGLDRRLGAQYKWKGDSENEKGV
jgi:hypothetical protein